MSKRVRISWNNATAQWRMEWADSRKFIQEFYDCENFGSIFPEASKTNSTIYKIKAEKLYTEGEGA